MNKAPIGLYITTYELSEGKSRPVLSHIFWGGTLREAVRVARSHMIDDTFFSSSFVGEMPWKDYLLYLENQSEILGPVAQKELSRALDDLYREAHHIREEQDRRGIIHQVQILSQEI